jgi:N-acyl amino acid synthase of PEP-CTERM/exosortase system
LLDAFKKWFEVVPAVTDELRDAAFRLRHDVYCESLGYEPVRADGRETDAFDAYANHLLVRHVATNQYVGCARLVRVPPDRPTERLPFERICGTSLQPGAVPTQGSDRLRIAEVSRLAIARNFHRRTGEETQPATLTEESFQGGPIPRYPYILAAVYLGLLATASSQELTQLFLLTEARLADHLRRVGMNAVQIGPPVEHRGPRVPSVLDVPSATRGLIRMVRPMYDHILQSVTAAYSRDTV